MNYYLIANIGSYIQKVPTVINYPYHLVLAQVIGDSLKNFRVTAELCRNKQVILDNGAYEGFIPDWNNYVHMTNALCPWCVVLPDIVRGNAEESRELAFNIEAGIKCNSKLMYVPQGRNREEVLREFQWVFQNLNPDVYILGVGTASFFWGKGEEHRQSMLQEIFALKNSKLFKYHMLGARKTNILPYTYQPNVIGIDTFKPCRWAMDRREMPNDLMLFSFAMEKYPDIDKVRWNQSTPSAVNDIILNKNITAFCYAYGIHSEEDSDE